MVISCKKCVRYLECVKECPEIDTEAADCELYDPMTKHLEVPCAECKHYQEVDGRLVRARCIRTGTAFLQFKMGAETAVLDPKVHTCREAVLKSQTFGKER